MLVVERSQFNPNKVIISRDREVVFIRTAEEIDEVIQKLTDLRNVVFS